MPNNYTNVDELKGLFPANRLPVDYDAVLDDMIETASREIDAFLGREPGTFYVTADSTRYFDGCGGLDLWVDELAALPTTIAVAESGVTDDATGTGGTYTTWAVTDYYMWPQNALAKGMPFMKVVLMPLTGSKSQWYSYPRGVKMTGKFGFSTTVPPEIKKACNVQCTRYFKRAQQAFADAGAIVELGQMTYVKKLDPDVENILMAPKFARSIL
jgi:hypothetical protein